MDVETPQKLIGFLLSQRQNLHKKLQGGGSAPVDPIEHYGTPGVHGPDRLTIRETIRSARLENASW